MRACLKSALLKISPQLLHTCTCIFYVQYVCVLGVLRSRTTQAWEDGSRLQHRAKKITFLPQAPSSRWAPPRSRLSRLRSIRERAPSHPPGPATHPPALLVSGVRASSFGPPYAMAADIYSSLPRWLRWGGDGWRWQVGWCRWGGRGRGAAWGLWPDAGWKYRVAGSGGGSSYGLLWVDLTVFEYGETQWKAERGRMNQMGPFMSQNKYTGWYLYQWKSWYQLQYHSI